MTTISLSSSASNASQLNATPAAGNGSRPMVRDMPTLVPASELYFWSAKWQSQEHEFDRADAAGELLVFNTMDAAIADLMRVDDEDDEG
jgi:hypothetical protein